MNENKEPVALPISHSDIKLSNFLLVKRNGKYHVVISDFGLATTRLKGITPGARGYLPPEHGDEEASPRLGDTYSLGMAYKKVADALPEGESRKQLLALSEGMTSSNPENRTLPDPKKTDYFKNFDTSDDDFTALIDFVRAENV